MSIIGNNFPGNTRNMGNRSYTFNVGVRGNIDIDGIPSQKIPRGATGLVEFEGFLQTHNSFLNSLRLFS